MTQSSFIIHMLGATYLLIYNFLTIAPHPSYLISLVLNGKQLQLNENYSRGLICFIIGDHLNHRFQISNLCLSATYIYKCKFACH